ncbi:MAG: CHASE2 domain-containing protein [Cyanobacteria bacterium P01_A01_bin.45]
MNKQLDRLFSKFSSKSGLLRRTATKPAVTDITPRSKQLLSREYKELVSALSLTICIFILRSAGLFQGIELAALDKFFQLRPQQPPNDRITIIEIDELSLRELGSWPIADENIAELLETIKKYEPRAIGLDIYRDLPVEPGTQRLENVYKNTDNLIGIELLSKNQNASVKPPSALKRKNQVGFNNIVVDTDGKVRRSLLYSHDDNQRIYESFALKLALLYLKLEGKGISPKKASINPKYLQLDKSVFPSLEPNYGGYVGVNNGGYQILVNYPKPGCKKALPANAQISTIQRYCTFRRIPLRKILKDKKIQDTQIQESWFKDKIVLIGSTANSLGDSFFTPHSSNLFGLEPKKFTGIEIQAYFISSLLQSVLENRPPLKVWSDAIEYLWIFFWSCIGSFLKSRVRNTYQSFSWVITFCLLLVGGAYIVFLRGWWIPLIPPLISLSGGAIAIAYQIAHMQEELKRSKEFLEQIINTIPDPVYVKDNKNRWTVLNTAFCQFIGHPKTALIDKSDRDFFPIEELKIFQKQDKLVFITRQPHENEEKFTNAQGFTHLIATKRSLHQDAAGNYFLVGIIRDITKRKQREEELKLRADELFRRNTELKSTKDNLHYLAYHDPLTGLPNRKFFLEQLAESINWAKTNNLLIGLLFIDLDGFKQVNDTLGHEIGDRLLVTVAQRFINCLRGSDTVARLAGDEFTVILRAIPKIDVATRVAQKILKAVAEPIILEGNSITVSASIGISIYPLNSQESETLIKQADSAMYRAKHLGKSRYEIA